MTELGRQRLVSTELVLDLAAVALTFPFHIELLVVAVDSVWWLVFPLILFSMCCRAGLVLMWIIGGLGLVLGYMLVFAHHLFIGFCQVYLSGRERS